MEGASRHHDLRGKSCLYKEFYSLKLENNNTNFAQQLIDLMLGQCGAMWDRVHQDRQHPVPPAPGIPKYGELRTRNLKVLGTVIKLLVESKRSYLVYHFWAEIYIYYKKDSKDDVNVMSSSFVACRAILFTSVSTFQKWSISCIFYICNVLISWWLINYDQSFTS